MSKYRKSIYFIVLFTFSFFSVFWMLSIDNGFNYDDVVWLLKVSTNSYEDLFSFFPHSVYNDRPIGAIFLKFLYSMFELDFGRHHIILVILHLLNVLLTFLAVKTILCRKHTNDTAFRGAIISAAFFGMWSRTHMAVQWDAAIFDLLGTSWSLLSMLFYLRSRNTKDYTGQNTFFAILFYYLALRTKEMFLILPILFVLYEIWEMFLEKERKTFTLVTKFSLSVGAVFLSILFYLKLFGEETLTNDINNPYYQSFHPMKLISMLFRYCMVCFDLENGNWGYAFSISGLIGTIILTIGLAAAGVIAIKKKEVGFLMCYMAIGASIAIVLPMVNQVHVLYLYFPSIFVGLLIACTVVHFKTSDAFLMCLMCFFLVTGSMQGSIIAKNFWLENAKTEKQVWNDIREISPPMPGTSIYVKNIDNKDYTPFFYGEGDVCRLLYQDISLKVQILTENEGKETEYTKPYVVWEYRNGRVQEVERMFLLSVNEVYEYPQEDGTLILGIVPDKISSSMAVYIDETKLQPVIGETFISVQIPADLIEDKKTVMLKVEDQYGTLSEGYILDLTN